MIPTEKQYHELEQNKLDKHISWIYSFPQYDKLQNRDILMDLCRSNPDLIAERINWLLLGTYGYAEQYRALNMLKQKRSHIPLFLFIALLEWHCPDYYARKAYKLLTKMEKMRLDNILQKSIEKFVEEHRNN